MPTVKSRVERLKLGVIRRFTIEMDYNKFDIPEAILMIGAKPQVINTIAEELNKLDEVKQLYITLDSSIAIVAKVSGDMQQLLSIQEKIDLRDVNSMRINKKKLHKK